MKALIQRVKCGSVTVGDRLTGSIGQGLVILLGVMPEDTEQLADYLADRCAGLRIFEDEQGKMNRSLLDIGGAALVISQFTLCADVSAGRRPSFPRRLLRRWRTNFTNTSNLRCRNLE